MNPFATLIAQVAPGMADLPQVRPPSYVTHVDPPEPNAGKFKVGDSRQIRPPGAKHAMGEVRKTLEPVLRRRDLTIPEAEKVLGTSYAAAHDALTRAVFQGYAYRPERGVYRHIDRK